MGKWLQMLVREATEAVEERQEIEEIKKAVMVGHQEKDKTTQHKNHSPTEAVSVNADVIEIKTLSRLNAYGILPDDKVFVNRILLYKPEKEKQQVIDQYGALWLKYYKQSETDVIKRENIARYYANDWLRKKYLR